MGLTLMRLPSLRPSTVFSSAKLSRVTPSSWQGQYTPQVLLSNKCRLKINWQIRMIGMDPKLKTIWSGILCVNQIYHTNFVIIDPNPLSRVNYGHNSYGGIRSSESEHLVSGTLLKALFFEERENKTFSFTYFNNGFSSRPPSKGIQYFVLELDLILIWIELLKGQ